MKVVSERSRVVTRRFAYVLIMIGLSLSMLASSPLRAQDRTISYQGTIIQNEVQASDGLYQLTVALYGDPQGKDVIWTDSYTTEVKSGIFNIRLGSAKALPDSKTMDQPLWLGVSVNGTDEQRPLTKLGAVSLALNVADEAVTLKKLAPEVIGMMMNNSGNDQEPQGDADAWTFQGDAISSSSDAVLGTKSSSTIKDWYLIVNGLNALYLHPGYANTEEAPNLIGGRGQITHLSARNANGNFIGGGGSKSNANDGSNWISAGEFATIGGGTTNLVGNSSGIEYKYQTIAGGRKNQSEKDYTTVGGGYINKALDAYSTVAGGNINTADGDYSTIGGGSDNSVVGDYGAIPGGYKLKVGTRSFGFSGQTSAAQTNLSGSSQIAAFVDVDLQIRNVDNSARSLQFFEPSSSGTNISAFKAQAQSADINYILPASIGVLDQVLTVANTTGTTSTLEWADGSGVGGWKITGNSNATAGTHFLGTTNSQALDLRSNNVIRLRLNTNGSIQRDNGGNARGANAIDLQNDRANATEVAQMEYSVIAGGYGNTAGDGLGAGGAYSSIGGGLSNVALADYSVVGGGFQNQALDVLSTVSGGSQNKAHKVFSVVGGGSGNEAKGEYSTIGGGVSNFAEQHKSTIAGGANNYIWSVNDANEGYSFIGGGWGNKIGSALVATAYTGVIAGGDYNSVNGKYGAIVGGHHNKADGNLAFVGGGGSLEHITGYYSNHANGDHAVVVGGGGNIADGDFSFIGGGGEDPGLDLSLNPIVRENRYNKTTTDAKFASIPGGRGLWAQSYGQTVLGVFNKKMPTATEADFLGAKEDERIFIIGNGTAPLNSEDPDNGNTRSNAYEVSNNGHSIVYDKNVNNIEKVIRGARYIDNTPIAWGRVDGLSGLIVAGSGFGATSQKLTGGAPGRYRIDLNYVDPYSGAQIQIANGSSVIATIEIDAENTPACMILNTTPVTWTGTTNQFFVRTQAITGGGCSPADGSFFFVVFGRP